MSYQLFRFQVHQTPSNSALQNNNHCFSSKILKKQNSHFNILEISVNGDKQTNKMIIVNTFSRYFTKLGPSLANKLVRPIKPFKCWMNSAFPGAFSSLKLSPSKVLEYSYNLNCSKATGFIPVGVTFIQTLTRNLYSPLCYIFNSSLETAIAPDILTVAKVTPILKGAEK